MKLKKMLSGLMAGVLALSLSVPALAASTTTDNTSGSQNYQVEAAVNTATIKVTVPSALTNQIKLNPYMLAYTDAAGLEVKEAIFSPAQYMTNLSDTPIAVTAAVKATQGGDVKLLASKTAYDAAVTANSTDKNVYMYLEMLTVNDSYSTPTWAAAYDAAKHLAIVDSAASANGQQKKNIATMEAAANGMAATEKGVVAFHFVGAANDKTEDVWAATDKIDLDITFTFTPLKTSTGVTPEADEAVGSGGGGGGVSTPSVSIATAGTVTAGTAGTVTLTATPANLTGKNPSYSWAVTTDDDSIVDSFSDSGAVTQSVNITSSATAGQTATLTLTVTYDDVGSGDGTLTETVTITVGA